MSKNLPTSMLTIYFESFSDMIRHILYVMKYQKKDLAERLDIEKSTITRWVSREKAPNKSLELLQEKFPFTLYEYSDGSVNYYIEMNLDSDDPDSIKFQPLYNKENQPPTPSEQVNEPAVDFNNKDLHKIMLEVMEEATPEDKAVLGKYFIKVLSRYKGE